jgi:beta-mannosidase
MELAGSWRAIEADDTLRRVFPDPDLDDGAWAELAVPGHWQSAQPFAGSDGPLLYRRRFESPPPEREPGPGSGRRVWLDLDGLFYQGDVWLDGSYLGDTEGYFFAHRFEVTELIGDRAEHLLAIEVACPRPADKRAKRNLTGVFQHWDCFDQDWNPGGIWRPVRLAQTGSIRLTRLRVVCPEATAERATLDIRAELDAIEATAVTLTTTISRTGDRPAEPVAQRESEHPLAAGGNVVRWRLAVEQPELWWPHALGDQSLYDVSVLVRQDGKPTDMRTVRTGLRQVRMKNFITTVNNERLYLKGANQGPSRRALGDATPDDLERDVQLARQAGLDLLRIHGHITRPELYAAADRHGLLLWQDMPLQWGYSGMRRQAARQAVEAVDLLGHHPSVAIWCGHNEPFAIDVDPAVYAATGSRHVGPTVRTQARLVVGQTFPTWNKTALDRSIRRSIEKADGSRPVVAHSGVVPHPAWGTDSHLYYGWYHGEERDLPRALAGFPVLARFVSEFGAQAVPGSADFCEPARWPELDWPHLARAHCLQKSSFDRYVPPADYATFESWRDATQAYQAMLIRHHIETLRRLKYRPTGGFCQFCFADGQPAVTWSVLDHERNPKAGFEALAAACAPVIVVSDRPALAYGPGSQMALDVHVVSDLRTALEGAQVRAELTWPGGAGTWYFEGDVKADNCTRVGRLVMTLPATTRPGPLVLDLDLEWSGGKVTNRYESVVT